MFPRSGLFLLAAWVAAASVPGTPTRRAPATSTGQPKWYLGLGHSLPITRAAWSPDGNTLATGSDDHTTLLWDRATWRPRLTLAGHTSRIRSLAWSPDGKGLVSSDDNAAAVIWDTTTGWQRAVLTRSPGALTTVRGRPSVPAPILTLAAETEPTQSLAGSPHGRFISGTEGPVRL